MDIVINIPSVTVNVSAVGGEAGSGLEQVVANQAAITETINQLRDLINQVLTRQGATQVGVEQMAGELQRLQDEVTQNQQVVSSAVTLIEGLAQQIRNMANDPAALNALADQLDSQRQTLAQAVTANTPAQDTGGGSTGGGGATGQV